MSGEEGNEPSTLLVRHPETIGQHAYFLNLLDPKQWNPNPHLQNGFEATAYRGQILVLFELRWWLLETK